MVSFLALQLKVILAKFYYLPFYQSAIETVTKTALYSLGQARVAIYKLVCLAFLNLYYFHKIAQSLCVFFYLVGYRKAS